jgi:flagellar biosynthesis protein FlhG
MGPLLGSHYEILGLEPTATFEQVERAYRYHIGVYSDSALATYSLLDPGERQIARAQVQEAYDVLKDPLRRRTYDVSIGLAPAPVPVSVTHDAPPLPRGVALEGPVTGAALRGFREQSGVSLKDIAERSKVGLRYLQYIEEDRHNDLPARVYLRGFLLEYARALGLEPARTADAYLATLPKR